MAPAATAPHALRARAARPLNLWPAAAPHSARLGATAQVGKAAQAAASGAYASVAGARLECACSISLAYHTTAAAATGGRSDGHTYDRTTEATTEFRMRFFIVGTAASPA
jgi:hypothetical protein